MDYEVSSPHPWLKQLTLRVSKERTDQARSEILDDLAKKARLPGFRPGKAPLAMIAKAFEEEVKTKILETVIPEILYKAITDLGITPLGQPRIEKIEEDGGLRFTALIEVTPEISLEGYTGIPVTVPRVEVSKKDVAAVLESLRNHHAILEEPSGDRPCRGGDVVVVDLKGTIDDKPVSEKPLVDYSIELGKGTIIPGVEKEIIGLKKGENKTVEIDFPADDPSQELAGKKGVFEVTIKAVKEKHLPDLTDEFAKSIGDYDGLADLKNKIKEQIAKDRRETNKARVQRAIVEKLLETHRFELPPSAVEKHINLYLEEGIRSMRQQGMETGHLRFDDYKLRDKFRPRAKQEIRRKMITEAIADKENINAKPEEVETEIKAIADSLHQSVQEVRNRLETMGAIDSIVGHIRERKTMDFLEEKAKVTEISPEKFNEPVPSGDREGEKS